MGCIVNGPGESKHADIGISLPGTGETPAAPVFIDGKKAATLRGPTSPASSRRWSADYIETRFGRPAAAAAEQPSDASARRHYARSYGRATVSPVLRPLRGEASSRLGSPSPLWGGVGVGAPAAPHRVLAVAGSAEPSSRSARRRSRPPASATSSSPCRAERPAARLLRPPDLEGKPLRPERGQPGRRRRRRPVHAGHGEDARPRQFLRHRAGDPGFGPLSRRDCEAGFGNLGLAAAAYNAGESRVSRWLSLRRLPAARDGRLCARHHGRAGRQFLRRAHTRARSGRSTRRPASTMPAGGCAPSRPRPSPWRRSI